MTINGTNLAGFKERVEDLLALNGPNQERIKEVREAVNSVFEQCDRDNNTVLDETELKNAITIVKNLIKKGKEALSKINDNKTADSPQPARNPKFRGLESYNLVLHGAKEGIGMITIKGENLIVMTNPKSDEIELVRFDNKVPEYLTFKNMDELKNALLDQKRDWGKYPGYESLDDVFIP